MSHPLTLYRVLKEEYEQFHGPLDARYYVWKFQMDHIRRPCLLAWRLSQRATDPIAEYLWSLLPSGTRARIDEYVQNAGLVGVTGQRDAKQKCRTAPPLPEKILVTLVDRLNAALGSSALQGLPGQPVAAIKEQLSAYALPPQKEIAYLNRLLLEHAFRQELSRVNRTLSGLCAQMHRQRRAALCLSGGGIRSASFGLGILQGLARHRLLDQFHYLSTVSGGGYLGAWLTAWIHRHPDGLPGVMRDMENQPPRTQVEIEPEPVRHLRHYSNYLNPQLGLLSADTWTLVSTVARNILLNWLVLVPLLAAALMIPRLLVTLIQKDFSGQNWYGWSFALGSLYGFVALIYMGFSRPSAWNPERRLPRWIAKLQSQSGFIFACLLPLALSAIFLASFWALYSFKITGAQPPIVFPALILNYTSPLARFVLYGAAAHLLAFILYSFLLLIADWRHWLDQLWSKFVEFFVVLSVGAFWGLLAWVAATKIFTSDLLSGRTAPATELYACLGVPLFLASLLLATFIFVALTSKRFTEEDREWWARCGGWLLILIVSWSVLSALVIFGPSGLLRLFSLRSTPLKALLAALGGVSGVLTILGGFSAKTPAGDQKESRGRSSGLLNLATKLAAPVFVVLLIAGLSLAASALVSWLAMLFVDHFTGPESLVFQLFGGRPELQEVAKQTFDASGALRLLHLTPFRLLAWIVGMLAAIGSLFAVFVNINKFSLHGMYRNRLVRAYLGASRHRDERRPHPFTGFDPDDNIWMSDLLDASNRLLNRRLVPVVNICLNLVKGRSLAWQQRKAASFTVSPLHAGSLWLGYRRAREYGGETGITLGTAATISGAAVSPNMGYHSSPALTFLLTLFNARLGWWLGNPGEAGDRKDLLLRPAYRKQSPSYAVSPVFAEALSLTDETKKYVYLSDGGHFENLGLYEMVLRRCHIIIASDGTQDGDCNFNDLGNAVHKVRVDLGIPIEFVEPIKIFSKTSKRKGGQYYALARIKYDCVDEGAPDGVLVYLKPAVYGREPVDVVNYSNTNADFPHQTTVDQYFDEAQFESYRMLGSHVVEEIWGT